LEYRNFINEKCLSFLSLVRFFKCPELFELPVEYAPSFQTYNDIPSHDARRIQTGWALCPFPGMPFNNCMSFPTELKLRKSFDCYRLYPRPVREIKVEVLVERLEIEELAPIWNKVKR